MKCLKSSWNIGQPKASPFTNLTFLIENKPAFFEPNSKYEVPQLILLARKQLYKPLCWSVDLFLIMSLQFMANQPCWKVSQPRASLFCKYEFSASDFKTSQRASSPILDIESCNTFLTVSQPIASPFTNSALSEPKSRIKFLNSCWKESRCIAI